MIQFISFWVLYIGGYGIGMYLDEFEKASVCLAGVLQMYNSI